MKVFVSYHPKDLEFVKRLTTDLRTRGLDVWHLTERDLDWSEVAAAIEEATHLLFVSSPESIDDSSAARDELKHAQHHRKKIVVVLARPVSSEGLPPEIIRDGYQLHDFTAQSYDDALRSTAKALYASHEILTPPPKKERDWLTIVGVGTLIVFVTLVGLMSLLSSGDEDNSPTPDLAGLVTDTPAATITLLPAGETDDGSEPSIERVTETIINAFPCEGTVVEDLTPYYRAPNNSTLDGRLEEHTVLTLLGEVSAYDEDFYTIEIMQGETHYVLQDDVEPGTSCP